MVNYANRGKWFETIIDKANRQYEDRNIALIHKIPTPMSYNNRTKQARYTSKSTVDFVGCYLDGTTIAFDTKEVKGKIFPLANVKPHQEKYLKQIHRLNGIAFLLIHFKDLNKCYRLDILQYLKFQRENERKSIPINWFEENARLITSNNGLYFDYLDNIK